MSLQKQSVALSFIGGVDTKTDDKQVIPGKLLLLENGSFISPKEIRKRNGFTSLPTSIDGGSSISNGVGCSTFKNELLEFDRSNLYSYSESTGKWFLKDDLANIDLSVQSIVRNALEQTAQDSCFNYLGVQCFVWEDSSGGCRYSVIDSATGNILVNNQLISTDASRPRVSTVGNFFVVIFYDTVTQELKMLPIPALTPSSPQAISVLANSIDPVAPNYDAQRIGERIFVAYNDVTGGGAVSLFYLNAFLQQSSDLVISGESASGCVSVFGNEANNDVWVAYYDGTDVKYLIRDYALSLSAVLAPTTIETIADVENIASVVYDSEGYIYYTISQADSWNWFVKGTVADSAGAFSVPVDFLRSVSISSRPFVYNNEVYIGLAHDSDLQPTYFLAHQSGKIVARYALSNGGGHLTGNIVPNSNQISDTEFSAAYLKKDLFETSSGQVYTQTGLDSVTYIFDSENSFITAEAGNNLEITGASLSMYDGALVVEHGFHLYPENVSISISGVGGSISAGTRQYSVCYEWLDNQGQIHRSAPSIGETAVNVGATSSNTLTIPTLRLTDKVSPSPVNIVVYRTEASGTVFYQLTSITSPLLNDTTIDTVNYVDTVADSAIIGNPILYTTGGVLENIPCPATKILSTYKNRVIYVPSEDRLAVGYSKEIQQGEPVEFASDLLFQKVDSFGGPINMVYQLDDKIIIFKEEAIFAIIGDGPLDTGEQNDFTPAQLITSDCGCVDSKSVVLMPNGLMFKSSKGIYLLNRGLQVSYIGSDVEDYNSSNVTSAKLVPDTNQVRFCLNSGVCLYYDYYQNQWSVSTNINAVDSFIWNGSYIYLRPSGKVLVESNTFTDDGQFIKLKIKTAWLSLAGIQGFQRIYNADILGRYYSPHRLIVSVAYDFNDVDVQQEYIDAETLMNELIYGVPTPYGDAVQEPVYGGEWPLYQFQVNMERQKCQAIRYTIEDTQDSDYGEGFSISAITLEVGLKQGLNKISDSRTVG